VTEKIDVKSDSGVYQIRFELASVVGRTIKTVAAVEKRAFLRRSSSYGGRARGFEIGGCRFELEDPGRRSQTRLPWAINMSPLRGFDLAAAPNAF
jgi:hypothetical protein